MTNPPETRFYKDFVKRVYRDLKPNMEFPDKTYVPGDLSASMWLAQQVYNPLRHVTSARISIVDFQAEPRRFNLWSDLAPTEQNDGLFTVQVRLKAMKQFIRETPLSSNGLVILWSRDSGQNMEIDRYFFQSAVIVGLAEALSARYESMHSVGCRIREEEKAHAFIHRTENIHTNTAFARVLQLCSMKHGSPMPKTYVPTLDMALVGAKVLDLGRCSTLGGGAFPIYLITTYGFDNWFLSFERRLSGSSPEACINAVGNREVDLISHAWEYVLKSIPQQRMDKETYDASRYLHVSTKMFKRDLENWDGNGRSGSVAEVMRGLSTVRGDIELFDSDLRDAYQIFVNNTTLLDARKGIQMAEKSIEMSEKSIKESERVRIMTIIALIFLPINLASSIFGMNVSAVSNDAIVPISAFFVTALGMFLLALAIWAGSSVFMRYQKLSLAHIRRALGTRPTEWDSKRAGLWNHVHWKLRLQAAVTSWWSRKDAMETLFDLDESQRLINLYPRIKSSAR